MFRKSLESPRWESNPRFRHTKTAGSRYNTGANQQSAQWESNPHIRHGKATGSRYIMGASDDHPECLAGFEPAPPRWHGGMLPLTPQALRPEHPAGVAPASQPWEGRMFAATPRTPFAIRNAEFGTRNEDQNHRRLRLSIPHSEFRVPHSKVGGVGVEPTRTGTRNRRLTAKPSLRSVPRTGVEPVWTG